MFVSVALRLFLALAGGLGLAQSVTAQLTVAVGQPFPDLEFNALLDPADYGKLGLGRSDGSLRLSDIPSSYLVIEFFNKSCRPCQRQVREVEAFYRELTVTGQEQVVRVLAVAVGNKAKYLPKYRRKRGLSYPIAADPDFDQWRRMGEPGRTPLLVFLKREEEAWVLSSYHFGVHPQRELDDYARALLQGRLQQETLALGGDGPDRHLQMPLDEAGLKRLARQLLLRLAGSEVAVERVTGNGAWLYRSEVLADGGRLFARAATRAPVCEVCHAVHFMYVFDARGVVLAFVPIHVTKYGNVEWNAADNQHLAHRLAGRAMHSLEFDPKVDAVSRATMSSALIFDEIRRTPHWLSELAAP